MCQRTQKKRTLKFGAPLWYKACLPNVSIFYWGTSSLLQSLPFGQGESCASSMLAQAQGLQADLSENGKPLLLSAPQITGEEKRHTSKSLRSICLVLTLGNTLSSGAVSLVETK